MKENKNFEEIICKEMDRILAPNAEWSCCRIFNGEATVYSSIKNPKEANLRLIMMAIFNTAAALEINEELFLQELQDMLKDKGYANPNLTDDVVTPCYFMV